MNNSDIIIHISDNNKIRRYKKEHEIIIRLDNLDIKLSEALNFANNLI